MGGEEGAAPPPIELEPPDTREIRAARWATRAELQGPIRDALVATGRALLRYRAELTDAAFAVIDDQRKVRSRAARAAQ